MSKKKKGFTPDMFPSPDQLEAELDKEYYRKNFNSVLRSTVLSLVCVTAVAVLIAVLLLPVFQIYGTSMQPTLNEGDIAVSVKSGHFETGDVIAFYYNNKVLVKRVIATAGDWVDMDEDGTVYVNDVKLDEPYLEGLGPAFGECDIELPYHVPESRVFVMGDNRATSIDSRSSAVGCIADEQIVGKIFFVVWPFTAFGPVTN